MEKKNNRKREQNQALEQPPVNKEAAKDTHNLSITDAIVLTTLTVSAYVFHYFFEFGYLSYFEIPAAFISFNLTEMIPAIFFLVVAYFVFIFVLWPYISYLLAALPKFLKFLLAFGPWLIFLVYFGFSWVWSLVVLVSFLLVFGIDWVQQSRLKSRRVMAAAVLSPNQPIPEQEENVSVEKNASLDAWLPNMYLRGSRFWLVYFLITAIAASVALGRLAAVTRSSYLVAEAAPQCAVVYATADRYICKPFNNDNVLENSFRIFSFQENIDVEFREVDIGPLHP